MSPTVPSIDPRGPRFGAVLTTGVLAVALVTRSAWLLGAQALIFGLGAGMGLRYQPYGWLFRRVIRPRLGSPAELEAEAPPRFAQAVGFAFAAIGVIGFTIGPVSLGLVATAGALVAAFLNAAFGLCLGCEIYLLALRTRLISKGVSA